MASQGFQSKLFGTNDQGATLSKGLHIAYLNVRILLSKHKADMLKWQIGTRDLEITLGGTEC